jgi:hypothetical protein
MSIPPSPDVTLPTSRAVGVTSAMAVFAATTLSSRPRTTSFLMCIKSDGVLANFSARQQCSPLELAKPQ